MFLAILFTVLALAGIFFGFPLGALLVAGAAAITETLTDSPVSTLIVGLIVAVLVLLLEVWLIFEAVTRWIVIAN